MMRDFYKSLRMLHSLLADVLPLVDLELAKWTAYAEKRMQGELQEQALASLRDKKFHCQGGNFYSLYPGVKSNEFVKFVVALQTISDYLDNLCDRAGITDAKAFAQLHLAMRDALDPSVEAADYYLYYPFKEDGGYLKELVNTSRELLARLPSYHMVKKDLLRFATLYSELQTYKHISPDDREKEMLAWLGRRQEKDSSLLPWEFAAATGSTLGMFMLAAAAYHSGLTSLQVQKIAEAYFPWISGLHIQMDYFIDQEEDRAGGDLNFIFYYENDAHTKERLCHFYHQAFAAAKRTPNAYFTKMIVRGLLALYLSDPKIKNPADQTVRKALLDESGICTKCIYRLCRMLRRKKII